MDALSAREHLIEEVQRCAHDERVDPVVLLAELIKQIQTTRSRQLDAYEEAWIQSGEHALESDVGEMAS